MSSFTAVSSANIETQLTSIYDRIEGDATTDLRGMVTKVEQNMEQKDILRKAQKSLEAMKDAQKRGDSTAYNAAQNSALSALRDAGLPTSDPLYTMLSQDTAGGKAFKAPSGAKDDVKNDIRDAWDSQFKSLERMLDGEMQSRSDIGQKLQFQLNEANSLYNRSIQAKSNIAGTHNKTADALVSNIRG